MTFNFSKWVEFLQVIIIIIIIIYFYSTVSLQFSVHNDCDASFCYLIFHRESATQEANRGLSTVVAG